MAFLFFGRKKAAPPAPSAQPDNPFTDWGQKASAPKTGATRVTYKVTMPDGKVRKKATIRVLTDPRGYVSERDGKFKIEAVSEAGDTRFSAPELKLQACPAQRA